MISSQEYVAQFHENQRVWIERLATGELTPNRGHRRLFHAQETLCVRTGANGVMMFPLAHTDDDGAAHDQSLAWLRTGPLQDVLAWSMTSNPGLDLLLLAQGYEPGFEPWWMTRDLSAPFQRPLHSVHIASQSDIDRLAGSQVPYIMADQLETMRRLIHVPGADDVHWLVVREGRQIIGQAIVNLAGDHAGLYNVGVDPRHRQQGIGTSLTLAAMAVARDLGVHRMNLNSTPQGERMYKRLGFQRIGAGQTWNLPRSRSRFPVTKQSRDILLALGTGNISMLKGAVIPSQFANTFTPQAFAARFGQKASIRYLLDTGQTPEILSLWQAGMKDEAIAAAADPAARELRVGTRQATPLHLAIEAGAGSLVIALIEAGANLQARDAHFRATPLDWAHACNKPTIARIIRQAGGK